jgi:acyl-CoA thioesterase
MEKLFFDLQPTADPFRWRLPVTDGVTVGRPGSERFMFGGVGLGSAIKALELSCKRPLAWATAQYLSFARPQEVVDLDVQIHAQGKHNTQARVVSHVGGKEILTVTAALADSSDAFSGQWIHMPPSTPGPLECAALDKAPDEIGMRSRLDIRVAQGVYRYDTVYPPAAPGNLQLWIRSADGVAVDASLLAVMADQVPAGIGNVLGVRCGGSSLDNTLRIRRIVPTEWVFCDIRILGVEGHGQPVDDRAACPGGGPRPGVISRLHRRMAPNPEESRP